MPDEAAQIEELTRTNNTLRALLSRTLADRDDWRARYWRAEGHECVYRVDRGCGQCVACLQYRVAQLQTQLDARTAAQPVLAERPVTQRRLTLKGSNDVAAD